MSRDSSVSTVSDHQGLNDRDSPGRVKIYFFLVQTGSGATQPPIQWVPGVLSPEVKRGRGVTLITPPPPHLVPMSRVRKTYSFSPPSASMECNGTAYFYNHTIPFSSLY
jgi:hypothetical protein